jgi:hypothetical protein
VIGDPASVLALNVEPDLTRLEEPGSVQFKLTLSNKSGQPLKNVSVTEATHGEIATFDTFASGDRLVTKSFEITGDETFVFSVTAKDATGNSYSIQSDEVQIRVGSETAMPTAEVAKGGNGMNTLLIVGIIIVVLIVAVAIALIVLTTKERRAKRLKDTAPAQITPEKVETPQTTEVKPEEESVLPPDIEEPAAPEIKESDSPKEPGNTEEHPGE